MNWKYIPTFNPCRTSSYASDLRSMQFNVRPFIAKVSGKQEGNINPHKGMKIANQIKINKFKPKGNM